MIRTEPGMIVLAGMIRSRARALRAEGITVEMDSGFGTVAIDAPGSDGVFMQGDDADQFCDEAERLWESVGIVTLDDCGLFLADPYTELLEEC